MTHDFHLYGATSSNVGGEPTMTVASRHSGPVPSSQVILYVVVVVRAGVGSDPSAAGFATPMLLSIEHCPFKYPDVFHLRFAVPPENITDGSPPNEMILPEITTEFEHAVS